MYKLLALVGALCILSVAGCSGKQASSSEIDKIIKESCYECHDSSRWEKREFTKGEWQAILERMAKRGARIDAKNREVLLHGWQY